MLAQKHANQVLHEQGDDEVNVQSLKSVRISHIFGYSWHPDARGHQTYSSFDVWVYRLSLTRYQVVIIRSKKTTHPWVKKAHNNDR